MLLGYSRFGDENKLQWLSPLGEPRYAQVFRAMLQTPETAPLQVDSSYLVAEDSTNHGVASPGFSEKFFRECGLSTALDEAQRADLAASLQAALHDAVCTLAVRYSSAAGERNICLGGGIALNALLVAHLEQSGKFAGVFTHPAAGNAGNAMGAALHVAHQVLRIELRDELAHLFLGPEYSDEEIKEVLDNSKLTFRYLPQRREIIVDAVQALQQDRILGWFQGRMEFGPRALGARSILASPLGTYVNENLNHYVKHRESFRPFAAAVQAEIGRAHV